MRILLKDAADGSLISIEATELNYDPSSQELCVASHNEGYYSVTGMSAQAAEEAIRESYEHGMVSLTAYGAIWEDEDDEDF